MAEYCLECYKKFVDNTDVDSTTAFFEIDLCEGCGEIKACVIGVKKRSLWKILKSKMEKRVKSRKNDS